MEEETTLITFRIDKNLKTAFERAAKKRDITPSQMLRGFIRNVIEEHEKKYAQKDLFSPPEAIKEQREPKPSKKPKKATSTAAGMFKQMKKGEF